jgi:hypothetical protein
MYKSVILGAILYECETWAFHIRGRTQTEGISE